ncbi:glycosyltransferase family 4 protein [Pseudomarimonas salicorniae]|uniref:Glycosyltransferase family 4 protein n=1 Tax=Pseudomarimonas salicorniae TaxID=2933270 RepID=A0ABT0GIT5_9GAMM|nr:glycosyltransferase family 1 protein [Lysobacter sp. CAU 1642]MCK7594460.1 glycosyltransferase family 4 protein [Lysobacter sp. CAU 1642]
MRIVLDMQGAQTESRYRGIGRYVMSFAKAVVRNRGRNEVVLALSGLFPETIQPIRDAFGGLLPNECIRVWYGPQPVCETQPGNESRRKTSELLREAFIESLEPDVVHVTSLFEGYCDDAVTSIGRVAGRAKVSVTLYDLIPLLNPDHYLTPNPAYKKYYVRKVEHLRRADLYLAISRFSRDEGVQALGVADSKVVNVSTAVDADFTPRSLQPEERAALLSRFGVRDRFVLYSGGADERKNLPRLIEAYGALPSSLRRRCQLLFAGRMPEGNVAQLIDVARGAGLSPDELLFTGYVSNEELAQLYSCSDLYAFASWHEGFGLPVLEAMACGAAVIGSNTSSLPEVIGLEEALFDPHDVSSIANTLRRGLEDEAFRTRLRSHGAVQARKFSWDETARRSIEAWEALHHGAQLPAGKPISGFDFAELREALAATLSTTGLADVGALAVMLASNESAGLRRQLLVDVSELCQRDAATGVQRVVRSYLKHLLRSPPAGFSVEPVFATREEGYRYARRFTARFMGLDEVAGEDEPIFWRRGDVFLGLDMQHHVQLAHRDFILKLVEHGVLVRFIVHDLIPVRFPDLFKDGDASDLHASWLEMIARTDGAICVSRATADDFQAWIGERSGATSPRFRLDWVHNGADFDTAACPVGLLDMHGALLEGLRARPTFLCVSTIEPRKGQEQILDAVEMLWSEGRDVNLVLVGKEGWKVERLATRLRNHVEQGQRLFWLEGIEDALLEKVYLASSCLVAASISEGFGLSLIEAARHGIPILARDIPVFREVAGDNAAYFRGTDAGTLAEAMRGRLESMERGDMVSSKGIAWSTWAQSTERLKKILVGEGYRPRQLLVDVSELVQRDARTGIQRVVRAVLKEWLRAPPEGHIVEPVYATAGSGYRYARTFTRRFLELDQPMGDDDPIDHAPGDTFVALDLQPIVQVARRDCFRQMRREGVSVRFVVYDLLCVLMPKFFPEGAQEGFERWLEVVAESDGAVCISAAVAQELERWMEQQAGSRASASACRVDWFHLGADVDASNPSVGLPADGTEVIEQLAARPTFLMVGTLEPRKGHAQVLAAFEHLWQSGVDVNLAVVGKPGWMTERLADRLVRHVETGSRLFWLPSASDEYLQLIYGASSCLIAASYGEGFGLPLIEAAQNGLPIIARDLPVFREVAGEAAYYFASDHPKGLSDSIADWLGLYARNAHPVSQGMSWLTWRDAASRLRDLVIPLGGRGDSLALDPGMEPESPSSRVGGRVPRVGERVA